MLLSFRHARLLALFGACVSIAGSASRPQLTAGAGPWPWALGGPPIG